MADFKATDLKLWVSQSSPATADITTSYTEVGYITDLNISEARSAIETSSKTDGDASTFIAGRRNWTIDVSAIYDKESDAGQAIFTTAMEAANGSVYFLITSSNTTDQEWHGQAVITSLDFNFPDNDKCVISASMQGTGALTEVQGDSTT